jgi:hypothetical protein
VASVAGPFELFQQAVRTYGAAVERLARAYEADPDLQARPGCRRFMSHCGGASADLTGDTRYARGSIACLTTWAPRMF